MKKLLVGILALLFSFAVFAGTTDLDRLLLHERYGEDPWLGFGEMNDASGVFTLEYDDADADAVCLLLDLPAGGTDVPVFLLASTSSDYGYFTNVTVPTFAIEDDAGGSYVKLDWTDSNDARLATGGTDVRLDINSPFLGLGYDLSAELLLAVTDTTGVAAMTQTGSGPTMSWTVPAYTFTNSTSMTTYTPSWVMGYDAGAAMTIAVANTTGDVTITQAGNNVSMAWTAAGGFTFTGDFEVVGATTLDALTLSGDLTVDDDFIVDVDGDITVTPTGGDVNATANYNITGDITQTGSTTISIDLDVDGTTNLDDVDIDGSVQIDGTVTGGVSGTAYTWTWHSDSEGDNMVWTDSTACLTITGIAASTGLDVVDANVTFGADFTVHTDDFIVDADGNITIAPTLDIIMNPTGGDLFITGDTTQTGSMTLTVNLDVDGVTNLDNTDIDGTFTLDGTTAALTCSTSVINYTPIFTFGYDVNAAMTFTTTETSGAIDITHTGNGTAITWAADSLDFTGNFSVDGTTVSLDGSTSVDLIGGHVDLESADIHIGFDGTDYMRIVTTQTSGNVAITHPGNTPAVTWTTGSLDITGDFTADGGQVSLDGSSTADIISATRIDIESPTVRLGFNDTYYMTFATTQTSSNLAITHTGTPAVTWTATSFDFTGTMTLDGTTIGGNLSQDGVTTLLDGSTSVRGVSAGFVSLEANDIRFGFDATYYMKLVTTQTTGAVAITHVGGSAPAVTWTADSLDFIGAFTVGTAGVGHTVTFYSDTSGDQMVWDDANEVLEITGTNAANALHVIDGDFYLQSGSFTLGASDFGDDVTIHGDTAGTAFKWDSSDDAIELDGVANISHEDATNAGVIFCGWYNVVYTQSASQVTVCVVPGGAYVKEVGVTTTTAFDDGTGTTIDVGWSGTEEGYASDLDIQAAGFHACDVFDALGVTVGASARTILATTTSTDMDATAGGATVYVEWIMAAPGSL